MAGAFRTPIIVAAGLLTAIVVTARFATARLSALGRSIFRGRQVTPTRPRAAAAATPASTTTAPAPSPAPARVATAIAASVKILAAALAPRGVVLCGIVMRREILRRRSIGFRLGLFASFCLSLRARLVRLCLRMFPTGATCFFRQLAPLLVCFIVKQFLVRGFTVMLARASDGFSRQNLDRGAGRG